MNKGQLELLHQLLMRYTNEYYEDGSTVKEQLENVIYKLEKRIFMD